MKRWTLEADEVRRTMAQTVTFEKERFESETTQLQQQVIEPSQQMSHACLCMRPCTCHMSVRISVQVVELSQQL